MGIEAAEYILEYFKIPIIFLTSNTDDATFQKAVAAKPYAFITKPFQEKDLQRAIEMTQKRITQSAKKDSKPFKRPPNLPFGHSELPFGHFF